MHGIAVDDVSTGQDEKNNLVMISFILIIMIIIIITVFSTHQC